LGVYGVAALVALVNAALYEVWRWRVEKSRPMPKRWIAGAGAALVLGHAYGAVRVAVLAPQIEAAPKVQVAVVQGNIDQKLKSSQGSHWQMVLDAYNPPTVAADASGADLIVWPEAAFPRSFPLAAREVPPGHLAKPQYSARLLIGVDRWDPRQRLGENSAFLLDPSLKVTTLYTKHHLVPFGEYIPLQMDKLLPIDNLVPGTFRPGADLVTMRFPARSLGGRETSAA
jgi:apolipoprotein N-acyltransferase